jgi:hypothetical protein
MGDLLSSHYCEYRRPAQCGSTFAPGFELMVRLCAPRNEFLDKVWRLPDVDEVE